MSDLWTGVHDGGVVRVTFLLSGGVEDDEGIEVFERARWTSIPKHGTDRVPVAVPCREAGIGQPRPASTGKNAATAR